MRHCWSQEYSRFMFPWPSISIHPCNENQLDALFILSLFRQLTSAYFGHICNPTSGGILYIYIYITIGTYWAFYWLSVGPGVYRVLVGKPEGKRPLGRPRRRWVDNIRTDLQEVGCGYMDWIGLTQDRDRWRKPVSVVMNFRVPWNAGNFLTSCKPVNFSRSTLHHEVSK